MKEYCTRVSVAAKHITVEEMFLNCDIIELQKPAKAGEVINSMLILSEDNPYERKIINDFDEGYYVRAIPLFENIRKVLDEFESTYNQIVDKGCIDMTKEEEDMVKYFNMRLAKALMQNECIDDCIVAKIILATRDLSNEIIVKVQ